MAKHKSQQEEPKSEDAIMERMNEALKKMMHTPHETQKEMVERRRQGAAPVTNEKTTKQHRRTRRVSLPKA